MLTLSTPLYPSLYNPNKLYRKKVVSTKDVHKMIKLQNDAFLSLSTTIAELHKETEIMRADYLRKMAQQSYSQGLPMRQNPFEAADKKERAEEEIRGKIISEMAESH